MTTLATGWTTNAPEGSEVPIAEDRRWRRY